MNDAMVTINARYQEVFFIANFTVVPELAGSSQKFIYEERQITIELPSLAPPILSDTPDTRHQEDQLIEVFMWESSKPAAADVKAVYLFIYGLTYTIPSAAAEHPHINSRLYDEEKTKELNDSSDQLHQLSLRAITYWFRVLWWKTGYHLISLRSDSSQRTSDGGSIINSSRGTRFYVPLISRTIHLPVHKTVELAQWSSVNSALSSGDEPPVWHEYLVSSNRRNEGGDHIAATIDLAVAAEARIRAMLDNQLPAGTPAGFRDTIRRMNMSDIFLKWLDLNLPQFDKIKCIKTLFEVRNGIMHRGKDDRISKKFVSATAEAVNKLVSLGVS